MSLALLALVGFACGFALGRMHARRERDRVRTVGSRRLVEVERVRR